MCKRIARDVVAKVNNDRDGCYTELRAIHNRQSLDDVVVSLNDDNQRFRDRHGAVTTLTSNHILRLARSLILGRQFSRNKCFALKSTSILLSSYIYIYKLFFFIPLENLHTNHHPILNYIFFIEIVARVIITFNSPFIHNNFTYCIIIMINYFFYTIFFLIKL